MSEMGEVLVSIPRGVPPRPVGKAAGVPTPAYGGTPRRRSLCWRDSHLPEVPPAMTPDGEMLGGASVTGQTTTANSPRADLLITKTPESGCVFPGASLRIFNRPERGPSPEHVARGRVAATDLASFGCQYDRLANSG